MIIGIDLGTTNSCVAVFQGGKPVLIPNSHGHNLTPSAVSIDNNGNLLVGLAARERYITNPSETAINFKRYMGTNFKYRLGNKDYNAEDLSSMVLRSLKRDAEHFLGQPVHEAVITVPAYFNDKQRKATKRAGELAGLKVERLINEPTAAALAFGLHTLDNDSRFMVFDLGGGTFDVSIVEIFEGIIEIQASTGNNFLGGEDFNLAIAKFVRAELDRKGIKLPQNDLTDRVLRDASEKARRNLSVQKSTEIKINHQASEYTVEIDEEKFEEISENLIENLREPIIRALRDSNLKLDSINELILIGGSTKMPIIKRAVTKLFSRFPNYLINPDEAVAMGAAVQASLKERNEELKEVIVTDVCPYSLGVSASEVDAFGNPAGLYFCPIIERNTTIPTSREQSFATVKDNQRMVEVSIYQGESRILDKNIYLGKISIDLPPRIRGDISLNCRFTYDIDGLLEVDIYVPETKKRKTLTIMGDVELSRADLIKRRANLEKLKIHPRDMEINTAIISRANKCYEQSLGEQRQLIAGYLSSFERALDSQDKKNIDLEYKNLKELLDFIDGETYL